jgi:glycosyltransferase involved in cell wall biosynthesis
MLLQDFYEPGMPARPAIIEIYGNCFPRLGHKVTWIMPAKGSKKEIQELPFGDANIFTIPYRTTSFLPNKVFNKLVFLWKEKRLACRIMRREGCNIIQVRNGIFEGLLAIYLKRRYGIPFVFQYSFPITEASLERYKLNPSKVDYFMSRVDRFMRSFVMQRADLILPISKWMGENLARHGIAREKMLPVPLAVNTDLFTPAISGEQIRLKYNLSDSMVVIYEGIMDKLRNLNVLFYALALVKEKRQKVKLLMVGDGHDRTNLEKLARKLGLEDAVVFTGRVPYFEVPHFIAASDIALSPIPPLDVYKVSSPCKPFEYMAVAKPVVANEEIPEHKEVLEESGGGILVPFTPEAFADAIIELLDNREKAVEIGRRGREWVVKNRSYEHVARKVESMYYKLLEAYNR